MRVPFYVGLEQGIPPLSILPTGTVVQESTGGDDAWDVIKGPYQCVIVKLGLLVLNKTYRVYSVLVVSRDDTDPLLHQRKVWRYFKNEPDVEGPYTMHTAPNPLKNFLRSLNDAGDLITPLVIAGEDRAYQDTLDYVEGVDSGGDDDEIVVL